MTREELQGFLRYARDIAGLPFLVQAEEWCSLALNNGILHVSWVPTTQNCVSWVHWSGGAARTQFVLMWGDPIDDAYTFLQTALSRPAE